MSIKTNRIDQIFEQIKAPESKNVLWLDNSNDGLILKKFTNGKWKIISSTNNSITIDELKINIDVVAKLKEDNSSYIIYKGKIFRKVNLNNLQYVYTEQEDECLIVESIMVNESTGNLKYIVSSYASNTQVYGVLHYYDEVSPTLVRTGNMDLHRTLPIQSKMRRCIINDLGKVVYYLDSNDSTKKEDGTSANLDGTDGQVMVEVPTHYRKHTLDTVNKTYSTEVSLFPFTGAIKIEKFYISAFEACLDRTENKLCSIINTSERYRGGDNIADWDNTYRNLLGRPISYETINDYRIYAHNRGYKWNMLEYYMYVAIYWLFVIEYATLHSQQDIDNTLTAEGFKQGGLGTGTNDWKVAQWGPYNSGNPVVPCGYTVSLGNNSGELEYDVKDEDDSTIITLKVNSYRGIEQFYGHIYKAMDGVLCRGLGNYTQAAFVCNNRLHYADIPNKYYIHKGYIGDPTTSQQTQNGIVSSIIKDKEGNLFINGLSGSKTTYFCDYARIQTGLYSEEYYMYLMPDSGIGESWYGGITSFRSDVWGEVKYFESSYTNFSWGTRLCYSNSEYIW